ncbi:hypothetical protein PIB30_089443 [Stylosanthes scabra]|uniref:Uncharacterized protein n=1 Tax=Stylosanthes scabra TaxID=79078 RepID=A0ABU6TUQ0_9FABA|nr:hypothetical protein [Stylosanthes scabra]
MAMFLQATMNIHVSALCSVLTEDTLIPPVSGNGFLNGSNCLPTVAIIQKHLLKLCGFNRETGRFPKLRSLGLHISSVHKDNVQHELLSTLQRLIHLKKLQLFFELKKYKGPKPSNNKMVCHIGCKEIELLQSLQHLSNLSTLNIYNAFDISTCGISFPPCITKLKLTGISFMNDDGMNAIGNLTRLRLLRLMGDGKFDDPFEINCSADNFSQLQVFQMKWLNVHKWKLGNGVLGTRVTVTTE